jgi:hypothetical protein
VDRISSRPILKLTFIYCSWSKRGKTKEEREREREKYSQSNKQHMVWTPMSLIGQIKAKKIKPTEGILIESVNSIIEKGNVIFFISNHKFIIQHKGAMQVQSKYIKETPSYNQKKI